MHAKKPKMNRPEAKIEENIIAFLRLRGWLVRKIHGDERNNGWPDLYATHTKYGSRWVEVKLPNMKGSRFTTAQKEWFPKLEANGTKIFILTGASETEYCKLFKPSNFFQIFAKKEYKL